MRPCALNRRSLVPFPRRQRLLQVVQLSEQEECIRSRRLSKADSLSARPVVERMEIDPPAGGGQSVCNFVYLLHLAPCPVWHSDWCECSEASASRQNCRHEQ